jgi:membrane protease YdiL (CAAX protease family)
MIKEEIKKLRAGMIFAGFTAYFFLLLFTLLPFLKSNFSFNSALYWFITGYFLFIPLFIYAIVAAQSEGNATLKQILLALNIRRLSRTDWWYSIAGLLLVFVGTGIIFGIAMLLHNVLGIRNLSTTPWFMEMHPFQGNERFLLLVWLPMFFFNIVGEEVLWRGYIQTRLSGKYSWQICAFLWMIFHLPFGLDMMIMLTPVVLIVPYVFFKTRNTLTGIFIHGMFNGPIFVLVALGVM